jgi:Barstar (barnase inhibitor)
MELRPGLVRAVALDVEATRREAEKAGYTTFVLPAEGIVDRASFFNTIRATFPLDPPLMSSCIWDAMSDSLWQGLYTHPSRRIAILWPNARVMARSAASDFKEALTVLTQVARSLGDPRFTRGKPKEIAVIVEEDVNAMSAEAFLHDLLRAVPELKPVLDEHLAANDTLLPHVMMADMTRFAVSAIVDLHKRPAVLKLLDHLEQGLRAGDEETRELILASFVENLIGEATALRLLKTLMGPNLRKEVRAICEQ